MLDFFYSGIQLYILLSPYLCYISFLYLDLYLLGDDTPISYGSFMRTKHVFVFIHIRNKDSAGTITSLSPPVKYFLLAVPRRCFFVNGFCYLCFVFIMLFYLFIAALWSPAGKGLTSSLSCVWCFLLFLSLSHVLGWVWDLIVSIPYLCLLP